MPVVLENVSKRYGGVYALKDVSVVFREARIYGVLGPNGAGKSTLFRVVAGVSRPSSGRVLVDEFPAGSVEAKARIGYSPELPVTPGWMTGCEYLASMWALDGLGWREALERAREVLSGLGAGGLCGRRAGEMSKGQRKLLAVAETLYGPVERRYYLLDEPFAGLSAERVERIVGRIVEVWRRGSSVIVATHRADVVSGILTDVVVVVGGRVALSANVEEYAKRLGYSFKVRFLLDPRRISGERFVEAVEAEARRVGGRVVSRGGWEVAVFVPGFREALSLLSGIGGSALGPVRAVRVERFDVEDIYALALGGSSGGSGEASG